MSSRGAGFIRFAGAVSVALACNPGVRGARAQRTDSPGAAVPTASAGPAVTSSENAAPAARSSPAAQPLRSCSGVGPIACDMPPRPSAELCHPASACLETTASAPSLDGMSIQCDIDLHWDKLEKAFSGPESAPEGSGVKRTAVINLRATEEQVSMFDATYLVAELPEGSCLVDFVHDWVMSRLAREVSVHTRWEAAPDGFRLHIEADRTLYDELDEGQGSDEHQCEALSYRVVAGRFTLITRKSAPEACPSVDAAD